MEAFGKVMVIAGLGMAALGGLIWVGEHFGWFRFGRLPGDVAIQREGFSLYVPWVSMLLLSVVASLVFWIVGALRK